MAGSAVSPQDSLGTPYLTLVTASATIASGQSLSGAVVCSNYGLIRLQMPATWTAAALTFAVSDDNGVTFNNLFDQSGNEYTVQAAAASAIVLSPSDFAGLTQIKIRSGTSGTPVAQGASRAILVVLRGLQ